jgi:hypothetical protein
MADIFQNIGRAVTAPIGGLTQGALQGLAPGYVQQTQLDRQQDQLIADIEKIRAAGGVETEAGRKMLSELSGKYNAQMFMPDVGAQPSPFTKRPPWMDPAVRERFDISDEDVQGGLQRQMRGGGGNIMELATLNFMIEFGKGFAPNELNTLKGRRSELISEMGAMGGLQSQPQPQSPAATPNQPPAQPQEQPYRRSIWDKVTGKGKEQEASQKIAAALPKMPVELIRKINDAIKNGYSYEEILQDPTVQEYLD